MLPKFPRFRPKPNFIFSALKPKTVSREKLNAFWKRYDSNSRIGKQISQLSERKVVPITKSVLGTVRIFNSGESARNYVKRTRNIVSQINSENPKRFAVAPIQILDIRSNAVLERVYSAPSLLNISSGFENRYTKLFLSSMRAKGVSKEEIARNAGLVMPELEKIYYKKHQTWDFLKNNVIVFDYDQKTQKFLFGIVDAYDMERWPFR